VELSAACGVPTPSPTRPDQPAGPARYDVPEPRLAEHLHAVLDQLSEAERRVAELAAAGHTNRQIADHLFVTVSTVEQHLTKTYRKLRVSRRTQLRAALSRAPLDAVRAGGRHAWDGQPTACGSRRS
jgi:DNA-binding NarL/FixJ family response regulator